MNSTIIAAIVTGIIGPIITLIIQKSLDRRTSAKVSGGRRTAITGKWNGEVRQITTSTDRKRSYEVSLKLSASKTEISGKMESKDKLDGESIEAHLRLTGQFRYENYLELNYISEDPEKIQFGYLLLKLDSDGTGLKGEFCGYGRKTEDIISGSMQFQKVSG